MGISEEEVRALTKKARRILTGMTGFDTVWSQRHWGVAPTTWKTELLIVIISPRVNTEEMKKALDAAGIEHRFTIRGGRC